MKLIVITGSIATGKSAVSSYLRDLGYPLVDTDQVARQVVEPGSQGLKQLVEAFGPDLLTSQGQLDRAYLGERLFSDKAVKERVNQILHPLIHQTSQDQVEAYRQAGHDLVFLDVPLYFETEAPFACDEVWVVYTDPMTQHQRLQVRNQISPDQAANLMANQFSIQDKVKQADRVIDNSQDLEATYQQIDQELARLKHKIRGDGNEVS
ncbi:dephospho-CoA kinase [Hutsoniella sourekii]|uniref:dephospho-CoA kinase n=1 Tax=Hutsoniella sourekii TaxID=87650 RepID=UPI0004BCB937|nr:dephospho-CoA kinase [Hutsoniella sourekii]